MTFWPRRNSGGFAGWEPRHGAFCLESGTAFEFFGLHETLGNFGSSS
jgi:hypothetical protein